MNNDLRAFDAIRPFEPEELPEVYDRLMADTQFLAVVAYLYPGIPAEAIAANTKVDVQNKCVCCQSYNSPNHFKTIKYRISSSCIVSTEK